MISDELRARLVEIDRELNEILERGRAGQDGYDWRAVNRDAAPLEEELDALQERYPEVDLRDVLHALP